MFCFLSLSIALVFFNLSALSVYSKEKMIRIGIIQHFGKNKGKSTLLIRSKEPSDYLEVRIPGDPFSYEYSKNFGDPDLRKVQKVKELKISTKHFPLDKTLQKKKKKSKLVVGSYRNFETAFANKQKLAKIFPEQNWLVLYPDPWQVCSYTEYSQDLSQKLIELKKDFAWLELSNLFENVLTWENNGFRFHRKKILIKSNQNKNLIVNEREYPGEIEINQDSFGTYSVVNHVLLEEYLKGVVPFEIGANAPIEAIKAQAVLARTYALANLKRFSQEGYNLCATQHCQVYKGVSYYDQKIERAIRQTKNQILVNPDLRDQTAQVFYYSSDGGHSANYQDNWLLLETSDSSSFDNLLGKITCSKLKPKQDFSNLNFLAKFLKEKASAFACLDSDSSYSRWTKEFTKASLSKQLKEAKERWKFNWPSFSKVKDISISKISKTGHVLELSVLTEGPKRTFLVFKDDIRAALGLKSTFFVIEKIKENQASLKFKIFGAGFGHGVGLSQYGAMQLAKLGKNYEEILEFYFPRYQLKDLTR